MPIYEYSCKKCGTTIEVLQKFNAPVLRKHQGCGGTLTKLISAAGFQFKGTGWYVTDYARKGKGGESESSKESKDTTEKSEKKVAAPKAESSTGESSKKSSPKPSKSSE